MKLAIAIAFLLASSLTAQAQQSGSKNRTLGNAYGAASGSSNASHVGGRSQTNNTQYGTYTGGGNVNPWNDRTCY